MQLDTKTDYLKVMLIKHEKEYKINGRYAIPGELINFFTSQPQREKPWSNPFVVAIIIETDSCYKSFFVLKLIKEAKSYLPTHMLKIQ